MEGGHSIETSILFRNSLAVYAVIEVKADASVNYGLRTSLRCLQMPEYTGWKEGGIDLSVYTRHKRGRPSEFSYQVEPLGSPMISMN
jgi:hypothetical protein